MMKLFKKKKSDNKLSTTMLQEQSSITMVPSTSSSIKKPIPITPINDVMVRSNTPPTIIMPKPRRVLTPTRAILGRFDNDKTQVEEEEVCEQAEEDITQEFISPILLPTSHHEEPLLMREPLMNKNTTLKQVLSQSTVASDDNLSRVYESAMESLTSEDELSEHEKSMPPIFTDYKPQSPFLKRVPVKSSTCTSSATITPLQKQPTPSVSNALLKEKEEQDLLLQQLKKQVEIMEQQRILDRQEWSKKEQELLNHRQEMMETLIATKDQLTNVLKTRDENKAREAYYQKQLQQQQLMQLQQQALKMQQQQQQRDHSSEDEADTLPQQQQQQQKLDYYSQHQGSEEFDDDRIVIRARSEEQMRPYTSRSSSRASNHPSHYQQAPEEGRRSAISRRNSNASNKSGVMNRFDPSPATTVVAPTPQRMYARRRAKSIESGKWHEDAYDVPPPQQQQYYTNRPRRSRSVGKRPSPVVYNDYYEDDDEMENYGYYDHAPPRYNTKYDYYGQQPAYKNTNDAYAGDYYSPRQPFPPQQMQFHPPPPSNRQQGGAPRYAPQLRHYTYNS